MKLSTAVRTGLVAGLCMMGASAQAFQVGVGLMGGGGKTGFAGQGFPGGFKSAYPFGALIDVKATDWLFIQPEFLLIEKGSHFEFAGGVSELRIGTFEMPLLLKAVLNTGRADRPFVKLGPYVAIPTAATSYFKSQALELTAAVPPDLLTSTEYGYVAAAGVEVYLAPISFDLELRGSRGLTPVWKDAKKGQDGVNSTVSVLLSAIYWFGL